MNRTKELKRIFSYTNRVSLEDKPLEIIPFLFTQKRGSEETESFQKEIPTSSFCLTPDNSIEENKQFVYTVFSPKGQDKLDKAILLLHGLNERSWDKYLTWAESLALLTGKAVILFPIAFHMNRSPSLWNNPRALMPWVNKRQTEVEGLKNATFVNFALSHRISESPIRLYASGRESVFNVWQLLDEIKSGSHSLFKENSSVDFFAYSIGALLSQVFFLSNPDGLVSDSKLFMFCGGCIFRDINGNAREILDKDAYDVMMNFYLNDFLYGKEQERRIPKAFKEDFIEKAFKAMIRPEEQREFRESFFEQNKDRIRSISLKKDTVTPSFGIENAMGRKTYLEVSEEWDFPYKYNHQKPFPDYDPDGLVQESFDKVFNRAAAFLA